MRAPGSVTYRLLALPRSAGDLGWKLAYVVVRGLAFLVELLPYSAVRRIGRAIGGSTYWLFPRRRRVGWTNIDIAYGDTLPRSEKKRILRASLANAGETAFGAFWGGRVNRENVHLYMEADHAERLTNHVENSEPFLALVPHMGNWELMAVTGGYLGIRTNFVVHRIANPYIDALVAEQRTRSGQGSIHHDAAARELLRVLRRGESISMVFDQNMREGRGGIFVDFFGMQAATARVPAAIALTASIPVYLVYTVPDLAPGPPYHRLFVGEPLELIRTGDKKADVEANTELFNKRLEDVIRRHPEHWLWTHKRFKSRPPGESEFY